MKNNTFDISRFGKYFVHDMKVQKRNIGMLLLVCALMPILFYCTYMLFGNIISPSGHLSFTGGLDGSHKGIGGPIIGVRFAVMVLTAGLFTIVFPSRAYGGITDKKEGSAWLMIPASRLEKYLSMMLVCLIVVPLTFIAGYLLSDWLVCLMDPTCGKAMLSFDLNSEIEKSIDLPNLKLNGYWLIYATIIEYAITFLVGALIFKKWKVVFTIIALFVLSNILTPVLALCASGVDWVSLRSRIETWLMAHEDSLGFYFKLIMDAGLVIWLAICGTWAWFRLKNRQH